MRYGRIMAVAAAWLLSANAACDSASDGELPAERGALGKADLVGSCYEAGQSRCGGPSSGTCWCDDLCTTYGDCCDDYQAVCKPTWCGGFANLSCPDGLECVDYPYDTCDPAAGGADCIGHCVEPTQPTCGGFANLPCPDGLECVDDPNDDCDPAAGGADCAGICVEPTQPTCIKTGCSGQICAAEPTVSTCEWLPWYACFKTATCEVQDTGECGFTMTPELKACLAANGGPVPGPSCQGSCGGQSADGGCWCDELCSYYGDCCDDYESVCSGDACDARTGGAFVTFEACGESVTVWVTDDAFIDEAKSKLGGGQPRVPVFQLADGADCDAAWSWHVEPTASWADVTIEVCDACPSYVESHKADFLSLGQWCPWGVDKVVAVDDRR